MRSSNCRKASSSPTPESRRRSSSSPKPKVEVLTTSGSTMPPLMASASMTSVLRCSAQTDAEHASNNLPDIIARWPERAGSERERARTEPSFCVSREEIASEDFDLSVGRYRQIIYEVIKHRPPSEIIQQIEATEAGIRSDLESLKDMLR
jgi:type I restriction enzyme M protein